MLILGEVGQSKAEQIVPFENEEELNALKERMNDLVEQREDNKRKEKIENEKERKELDAAIEEVGGKEASEILNEKIGLNLRPLKPLLHPIQDILVELTKYLRVGRNVLNGDVSDK